MDPDLVADLRPIRLPEGFEAFDLQGALAVFSVAILIGLLLAYGVSLASERKPSLRRAIAHDLAEARTLAPAERLLAQSRALAALEEKLKAGRRKPVAAATRSGVLALKSELSHSLYAPAPDIDLERVDREILGLATAARV
ncbi:hypothetical protein DYI37_06530 [Fulvimarina endophytica]|uniref:Uncharacterized protein n=1 Tax=Fulvimarina endophytica TaxID=2293836 RepID=A0A371X8B4_9HYPH|nr:hypothetical protein [Fulvimarina endophytica]RFC65466.1 hypothetical protein DYI37_06530 [Fulvimarina endophytica]